MKKYEVLVEDEKAETLTTLLQSLPFVKAVKQLKPAADQISLASENALSEDWLNDEDDELQKLYKK